MHRHYHHMHLVLCMIIKWQNLANLMSKILILELSFNRLAPVEVLPNVNVPEVANDAVADADTAATIFPYLDFLATTSKLVPIFLNNSSLTNLHQTIQYLLTSTINLYSTFVPLVKSIVTAFDPIVNKFIVLGNVGFSNYIIRTKTQFYCIQLIVNN
jgi:hypothetical protein